MRDSLSVYLSLEISVDLSSSLGADTWSQIDGQMNRYGINIRLFYFLIYAVCRLMREYCDDTRNRCRGFEGFTCFEPPPPNRKNLFYEMPSLSMYVCM